MAVVPARYKGSGMGFFVVGSLFLGLDVLTVLSQSLSEPPLAVIGGGAITIAGIIGGVIIAFGFSVKLFSMVEERLCGIERAVIAMRETAPSPSQPSAAPLPTPPPSTAA